MKKLVFVLAMAFVSCTEEPINPVNVDCNCGYVVSKDLNFAAYSTYSLVMINDCSGNSKRLEVTLEEFNNASEGSTACLTSFDIW